MSCNFNVSIPENIAVSELVEKGKEAFAKMEGEFNGDENKGEFFLDSPFGKISGEYFIDGKNMKVEIAEKPMMLPCSLIENEFKKYLNG
jgi:hypothetical protein